MKMKKGFTLAETLVTLSIVAVVAAIGIPAIHSLRPNQEMLMLKKVYYLTGRTVNELINDEDFYPDDETENKSGFSHVHTIPEARYHGHEYSGDTKFCGLFAARMNLRGADHCEDGITLADTFPAGSAPGTGHFTTADYVVWFLPINDFDRDGADDTRQSIYVDVNGDKPDNCFETDSNCNKPDRFEIQLDRYGRLFVPEGVGRRYLSDTNTTKTYDELKDAVGNVEADGDGDD